MALAFTTVPNNWRRVGHIITDKVYKRLTGEKGYFDTRIIYVSEEGPKLRTFFRYINDPSVKITFLTS